MWKCSQDMADADFTVGCDSAPLHPVRCPALGSSGVSVRAFTGACGEGGTGGASGPPTFLKL